MLALETFSVYIPNEKIMIENLGIETGLTPEVLRIYKLFYGLQTISVYKIGNVFSLLKKVIDPIYFDDQTIDYLVYLHTSDWVVPYGQSIVENLTKHYKWNALYSFELSFARCVSYFSLLELLQMIFKKNTHRRALVLTGEIAFTPALRVVPQSTIVSDAATAAIWSAQAKDHFLISVVNYFLKGFHQGIYLSSDQLADFDLVFIDRMVLVIQECLSNAKISLNSVRYILPHNVNIPTWIKISKKLSIPISRIYLKNIPEIGHAFCSDHLINLSSILQENLLKKGDYYIMAGCGMGFILSAALFRY